MEPQGTPSNDIDDLTIKVEKADGDLMYRTADNVGVHGQGGAIYATKGPKKGQVCKQGEHFFAFSEDGTMLNKLGYSGDLFNDSRKPVYGNQIFWTEVNGDRLSGAIFSETAFLVWVTVRAWYEDTGRSDEPFGKFVERTLHVTVYMPPKKGFLKLEKESRLEDHLVITNRVRMDAALSQDNRVGGVSEHLNELAEMFYACVYSKGMEDALEKAEWKGCSGTFGGVSVKAVWGFQRIGVELSNDKAEIELHIHDDSKLMYAGSVYGRLPEIRQLVIDAIFGWQDEEAREAFGPDTSVKNFAQALNEAQKS